MQKYKKENKIQFSVFSFNKALTISIFLLILYFYSAQTISINMRLNLLFLILLLTFASCKKSEDNKNDKIKSAAWLLGHWENNSEIGNLSENWKKANDSTFKGESFFIKNKDTLHFESMTMQQNGEDLIYNAKVDGQNKNESIPFKLKSITDKQLIFENVKHDYPQKIVYSKITKDSLVAVISGIQEGKLSSEQFSLKKTE